jgi:hypothetical protein
MLGMYEKPFSLIQDTREHSAPLAELLHKVGYRSGQGFQKSVVAIFILEECKGSPK